MKTESMTNEDFAERMGRIEADIAAMKRDMGNDIAEIKSALLGSLDGHGGLLGRVRQREEQSALHDMRIKLLETSDYVTRKEFVEVSQEVKTNTEFRKRITWMVAGAAAAGALGGGGLVAVVLQIFGA